jgi:hypothetical protein
MVISLAKMCCSALPCSWNKSDPSGSVAGRGTRGRLIIRTKLPNAHITADPTGRGIVGQAHTPDGRQSRDFGRRPAPGSETASMRRADSWMHVVIHKLWYV